MVRWWLRDRWRALRSQSASRERPRLPRWELLLGLSGERSLPRLPRGESCRDCVARVRAQCSKTLTKSLQLDPACAKHVNTTEGAIHPSLQLVWHTAPTHLLQASRWCLLLQTSLRLPAARPIC